MLHRLKAVAFALAAPLMLASCLFVPGKFESALTIHADHDFTFAYVGEVSCRSAGLRKSKACRWAWRRPPRRNRARRARRRRRTGLHASTRGKGEAGREFPARKPRLPKPAIAASNIAGNGMFWIDYRISGTLDQQLRVSYNPDNQMIMPWIAGGVARQGPDPRQGAGLCPDEQWQRHERHEAR